MLKIAKNAAKDIADGVSRYRLWIALAQEDIGDQHRRTALGPLWNLVNYLAFAGTFVVIFGRGNPDPKYAAYMSIGLFVWMYVSQVLNQGVSLFAREETYIKGTTLPLTVYVMRMLMQNTIHSAYSLVGCIAILLMAGVFPTFSWLWSLLGILIVLATTPAVIIVLAMLGVFFPDLQFIVQNIMRLGLFLTPIFWEHAGGGLRAVLFHWNPIAYFLDIVRSPVIDGGAPVHSIEVCTLLCVVLWISAIFLLGKYRKQVVFQL